MRLPLFLIQNKSFCLFLTLFIIVHIRCQAASYQSGSIILIEQPVTADKYISCRKLITKAPFKNDLYAAAQSISIEDSIGADLVTASETIEVKGIIMDDFRAAARSINISGIIKGDAIIFANEIYISKDAIIEGDLIVYSGSLYCYGLVKGNLLLKGGTIDLNGTINGTVKIEGGKLMTNGLIKGPSKIAVQYFEIGPNAKFSGNVAYWKEGGPLKLSPNHYSGTFKFDNTLNKHKYQSGSSFPSFLIFIIWHLLFGLLMFFILTYLWPTSFQSTGVYIANTPTKSFAYGLLYFILFPFITFLLFISIIGIPIAVLLFFLYLFSISCGLIISSLSIANLINYKLQKHWSKWVLVLTAAGILLMLHLVILIPFAGFLIITILACTSFGALLIKFLDRKGHLNNNKGDY